jgi:hypothetical protein
VSLKNLILTVELWQFRCSDTVKGFVCGLERGLG